MAAKVWSRTVGDANWSTAANWDGGTVPVNGDTVTFNGTSVLDCTIDALGTFNDNITVAAGYTGVITQAINISVGPVSIADGTWTKTTQTFTCLTFGFSGGVWNGGSGAMTTGAVTFSGGNLTATSGLWTVSAASFTQTGTPTFSANGGTITFTAGTAATLDAPNLTFNIIDFNKSNVNFTVAAGTTAPLGTGPSCDCGSGTFVVNGTVTWTDTLTLDSAISVASTGTLTVSGTIRLSVNGSLTFDPAATITASLPITFTGSNISIVTATAYTFPTCIILKTAQITIAASTTIPIGASPTTSSDSSNGTSALIVTGTLTVSGAWTHTGSLTVSATTGVVSGALTSVSLTSGLTINTTATFPASIPFDFNGNGGNAAITASAYTFPICTITNKTGGLTIANGTTIPFGASPTLSGTGTLTVSGTISISGTPTIELNFIFSSTGNLSGAVTQLNLSKDLNINASATFANGIILNLVGGSASVITAATRTFATSFIAKMSGTGTTTISTNTTFPLGANPTVNTTNGTLLVSSSGTITASGTITCATGNINIQSGGTISGAVTDLVVNDGGVTFGATATYPAGMNITMNITAAGASGRTFTGGGNTFGFLKRTGNSPEDLTIVDSNTFTYIQDNDPAAVSNRGLRMQAGSTTTLTDANPFRVRGPVGGDVEIFSTTSTNHIFTATHPDALIDCNWLWIQNITVDVAPIWYAGANSVDGGDAVNWVFANAPTSKTRKSAFIISV